MTDRTQQWQCISQWEPVVTSHRRNGPALEASTTRTWPPTYRWWGERLVIHYDSGGRRCRIYNDQPVPSQLWISCSTSSPIGWMPLPSTVASSRSARFTAVTAGSCVGSTESNAAVMAEIKEAARPGFAAVMFSAFGTVFIAELGDKTSWRHCSFRLSPLTLACVSWGRWL